VEASPAKNKANQEKEMNNPKNMLLIALFLLGTLLYMKWQEDYGPKPVVPTPTVQTNSSTVKALDDLNQSQQQNTNNSADIPTATINSANTEQNLQQSSQQNKSNKKSGTLITVETNVLKLKIDTIGGSIVYAELLKYPVKKHAKENIVLLNNTTENRYYAQSGLISTTDSFVHTDSYTSQQTSYSIAQGEIKIPLTIEKNGLKVVKTYTLKADSYEIELTDNIQNLSNKQWQGQQYRQLQRNNPWLNKKVSFSDPGRMSTKGVAYYENAEGYNKIKFKNVIDEPVNITAQDANWIAMIQHYFFSSIIIENDKKTNISTKYLKDSTTPYLIRATSDTVQIAAGESKKISTKLYIGPKLQENLPKVAKGLELTVDYGMFTVIAKPLFWVLNKIHSIVGNWGWSIILLTVLVKLLFFKLTEKQYNSMARMRKLQPRIKTLKERYKDNKQKFNEEMMALYKKEKVNPMGGCLPMLVQIPVFIALYWVLMESVELRQAPFMLWLQDLSSPDPYFILPAINAFAMFMTQRLSPTPGMDPMQAKIMKFMPLGFSVMFAFFQSGLVLYWAVNSSLSLIQQYVITKRIDAKAH